MTESTKKSKYFQKMNRVLLLSLQNLDCIHFVRTVRFSRYIFFYFKFIVMKLSLPMGWQSIKKSINFHRILDIIEISIKTMRFIIIHPESYCTKQKKERIIKISCFHANTFIIRYGFLVFFFFEWLSYIKRESKKAHPIRQSIDSVKILESLLHLFRNGDNLQSLLFE